MGLSSYGAEDNAVDGGDDDVDDVVLVFSQSLGARRLLMKSHEVAPRISLLSYLCHSHSLSSSFSLSFLRALTLFVCVGSAAQLRVWGRAAVASPSVALVCSAARRRA